MKKQSKLIAIIVLALIFLAMVLFSTPRILEWKAAEVQVYYSVKFKYFPVTVNPKTKTINENEQVNAFLANQHSLLGAAAADAEIHFWRIFESIAIAINNSPWYQNVAGAGGHFVTIQPGMRKEQVANAFGDALDWNSKQKQAFISAKAGASLPLVEGSFAPGLYSVFPNMTPGEVQTMVNDRFFSDIQSHYSSSTEEMVPLDEALIIASLIQRETVSTDGMRLLSGIIWNRLFKGMNLQIDATLQYAKANKTSEQSWWPRVAPNDKYIASPFNTYMNNGLPPAPISNPSVEAILAALNPVKTTFLYYFNDQQGNFHCSNTYAEHLALLKQYYGN